MSSVAVIDLGTISTRLLMMAGGQRLRPAPIVTHMGEGLATTGVISEAALERVRSALELFKGQIDAQNITSIRTIATSAARDAANREQLFGVVHDVLGVDTELLTGEVEGRLAFSGAVAGLGPQNYPTQRTVLLDIGGGSTEVSIGTVSGEHLGTHSADIGASSITATYFENDPPRPEELSAALSVIQLHLDDARRTLDDLDGAIASGPIIGVGGTITTIAAVELGLIDYDSAQIHQFVLDRDAVEDVFRTLATEGRDDRVHNPGLAPDRVDLIVGGAAILVEVMRHLSIEQIAVSEFDILDGVALVALDT
jgi:exopolyphosphatase/guanosine-5'-triphosphate,3'-diphosphate pyrophosphatase